MTKLKKAIKLFLGMCRIHSSECGTLYRGCSPKCPMDYFQHRHTEPDIDDIWDDLDKLLEDHHSDLKLSFGLEYSCIVDWVADLTPRINHPKSRQYGEVWRGQGTTREEAIKRAIKAMEAELNEQETE